MLIDASIHRIRSYAARMGWSAEKLASAAGLPESTVRYALKDGGNPTAETLRRLEAVIPKSYRAPKLPPPPAQLPPAEGRAA